MLDTVLWEVFEKTGSIEAYLLYRDLKSEKDNKDKNSVKGSSTAVYNR